MNQENRRKISPLPFLQDIKKFVWDAQNLRPIGIILIIYGLFDFAAAREASLQIDKELRQSPPGIEITVEQKRQELRREHQVDEKIQWGLTGTLGGSALTIVGTYLEFKNKGKKRQVRLPQRYEYQPGGSRYREIHKLLKQLKKRRGNETLTNNVLLELGNKIPGDITLISQELEGEIVHALKDVKILEIDEEGQDQVRTAIQDNGWLQGSVLSAVSRFFDLSKKMNGKKRMSILDRLTYQAYRTTQEKDWHLIDTLDPNYEPALRYLGALELHIFEQRLTLGQTLLSQGMISQEEYNDIVRSEGIKNFRQQEGYNKFLLWECYQGLAHANNPLDLFRKLQEALYLGYAEGVRDIMEEE